jgi:hypothetical protein
MPETGTPSGSLLANKAISSAWEVWAKMRPLVLSAMVASSIVGAGFALAQIAIGTSSHEFSPQGALLELAKALMEAVIATPVAVAMHRLILKGEVTAGMISLRKPYHWLFLAWLCLFLLLQNVLADLAQSAAGLFLAAVVEFGVAVLWLKSALLFPAIAIQERGGGWREQLLTSWRLMDGNFWLFFRAILLAMIPLLALLLLYLGVLVIVILLIVHLPFWDVITKVFSAAAAGAIAPAGVMVAAGVASWLYTDIRSRRVG